MPNTLTIDRSTRIAEAWTPWGPQSIKTTSKPASPKLASLRRRLEKLGKDGAKRDEDGERSRPDCSYDL